MGVFNIYWSAIKYFYYAYINHGPWSLSDLSMWDPIRQIINSMLDTVWAAQKQK